LFISSHKLSYLRIVLGISAAHDVDKHVYKYGSTDIKTYMKDNIKSAVGLTSFFVSLPPVHVFIIGIIIVGLLFGIASNFGKYDGIDLVRYSIIDGSLLLAIPALLSSAVIKLLIRKMPYRRIAAVTFVGQIIYGTAYLSSILLLGVSPVVSELILLVGAALVFILWYAIARLVFILKYRSVLFAVIQLLFYLAFLVNSHLFALSNEPITSIAKFYVASFILFGALYIFFLIINAPMKKSFGFSSTDAFSYFISQWLYKNKDMEKAFESVGSRVRTLVTLMGFEREGGKVFFVTPLVHFGPFGNLGGSEFSYLLAEELDKKYDAKSLVFHGTVTHDLNPVSSSQLKKIVKACDNCISNSKAEPANVCYAKGSEAECNAEALLINNSAFIGVSRAPYVTEDINLGIGLTMMKEAEKKADVAMLVDQHNAETGEITSFEPGDLIGYKYIKAVESAMNKDPKKREKLKLGVSYRKPESGVLGRAGIKISILSTNPEYVLILMDSNGITPEFREELIQKVKDMGRKMDREFEVGVFTTDTHATNVVRGVVNPIKAEDAIMDEVEAGLKEAVADMQEAKFFCAAEWFDIDVLGAKQSIEIVSTVNSIVAVAKIALPLILLGAMLILFAILSRI
jgi:putative membrane protein